MGPDCAELYIFAEIIAWYLNSLGGKLAENSLGGNLVENASVMLY